MEIKKCYLENHLAYKRNKEMKAINGLILHSVGCAQPSADVFVRNWNSPWKQYVCVHAFIDSNTGIVHQTLPWKIYCGHVGGIANRDYIGVEMCESNYIKYDTTFTFKIFDIEKAREHAHKTYKSAVELFAYLCNEFSINPIEDGKILSHSECFKRGIGSNHSDPEHYWNGLKLNYTMDMFRKDVDNELSNYLIDNREYPANCIYRITDKALNIRNSPSKYSHIAGVITDMGLYTIIEVVYDKFKQPWGKLKSGKGYICLLYATPYKSL